MAVPNTFATRSGSIPLNELDTNFATPITIGTTSVALGSTVTSIVGLNNLTYTGTLTGGTGVVAIGTNQIYKDASGNVGIGVIPNTNFAQGAKLQFGPYLGIGATAVLNNLGYYSVGGVPNWRYPLGNVGSTQLTGGLGCGGASYLQFYAAAACSGVVDSVATGVFHPYTVDSSAQHIWKNVTTELMRIDAFGSVGIGTSSPNASAILDAQSTTQGVRFPNMTTTQKNAIASPAAGLMVFDTTLAKLCVYSGVAWQTITSV
jgi:hypothetical protein